MTDFPLEIQLDVDTSAGTFPAVTYLWLDHITKALVGPERAELAGLPARTKVTTDAPGPLGPVGELFGVIEVERWHEDRPPTSTRRNLSDAGMAWLRDELADFPYRVSVWVGNLDEFGQRSGDRFSASVSPVQNSPGWLKLSATLPASRFVEPDTGTMLQRRWRGALSAIADQLNPGFGQISYYHYDGKTSLEHCTPHWIYPMHDVDPSFTIGKCRERLRGYAWLTIIAQELADKLGGVSALTRTGAFVEVRQLSRGGVWLLATEDFRDYTIEKAHAVFAAVAPVLRGGMPQITQSSMTEPPMLVVLQDPDTLRNPEDPNAPNT